VKVQYFEEQGLGVFLEKLRAQGWLELFTNTQLGCSVLDLTKFYAKYSITQVVVRQKGALWRKKVGGNIWDSFHWV